MLFKYTFSLFIISLVLTQAVSGQDVQPQTPIAKQREGAFKQDAVEIIHVTDKLAALPESRQAMQDFQQDRLSTGEKKPGVAAIQQIGASTTFRVMKNLVTNPVWEDRAFTLLASSNIANIWVADDQLDLGRVSDSDVTALEDALLNATPENSVDPTKGIVENNNLFFGSPPDVDGDGRLDILLYDITEGNTNSNAFVAGFVTPTDLSSSGSGNNKDVLHLDSHPGVSSRPVSAVLATAAHEYQHLIHFNYDLFELTFTNEGLSEWAEVLNGYAARTMTFLNDPDTYNVRLFGWDTGENILDDYQRAGLFTGYLAERLAPEAVASIARNTGRGRNGYEATLTDAGLDFIEVLKDYHTANLLDDAALAPRFTYSNATYNPAFTAPTLVADGIIETQTPTTSIFIEAGGVQYLIWKNVADFTLNLDTAEPFQTLRDRIGLRAILKDSEGNTRYEDLSPPLTSSTFAGSYDEIVLLVMHTMPELTSRVGVTYDASWAPQGEGSVATVAFDDGNVFESNYFSLSAGAESAVATLFDAPVANRSILREVSLSPFYLNQFSSSDLPLDAPRDLTLKIWESSETRAPGAELFSLAVTDPREFAFSDGLLHHFTVDLSEYEQVLSNLPDAYFIGYAEAGDDPNYMVIGPSTYVQEDRSYVVRKTGEWGALWDTQFSSGEENEFPLRETIIPIRALYEIASQPVSNEVDGSAHRSMALEQNFPNPFSARTTIQYILSNPGTVKLVVHNMLGQEVQHLVDRFQQPGNYSITFQTDSLPSGLYLYTLEAGAQRLTRRMTIVH